jgi:Ca2+-transporting ATPase
MTVMLIDVAGHSIELTEVMKKPEVVAHDSQQKSCGQDLFANKPESICMVLLGGALCNDAWLRPDPKTGKVQFIGDPTEGALLVAASHAEISKYDLYEKMPRVSELPFDSVRKRMTTVHQLPDDPTQFPPPLQIMHIEDSRYLSVTKGAVDHLLEVSSHVWVGDKSLTMNNQWRERIELSNNEMANKGMRVLGVAIRWLDAIPPKNELSNLEKNLIFVGLIGMIDPPRPEVKNAVQTCRQAGIRPVMITGDHPLTARFIANELGISDNGKVITGQDLDEMSEADFEAAVQKISVFARVAPEHKLKIVQALQNQGNIVAMTGDGVNDSPALKKADIGVAMGITGTDVSKEAANMILQDDNFATIVAAVEEGRVIYDNIRRFVKFSIAGNLGKVLVMLLSPLMGITIALLPLQLLWLNLLTDGLLGLGLGLEPAEKNTMRRPPRDPKANFFSEGLGVHVIWVGVLIGVIALSVARIFFDPQNPSDTTWRTMLFTVLAFLQVGQALGSRAMNKATISLDFRSNPTIWLMIIAVFLLQIAVIYAPFMDRFFTVTPLRFGNFLLCIVLMILVYIPVKLEKILRKEKAI